MLIKAILVTIIKTRYVKLFEMFLFGFGGFDNRQSVVCFLIVILHENSERETVRLMALKNVLLADRSDKNRTIKSLYTLHTSNLTIERLATYLLWLCDILKAHRQSRCCSTLIGWCWRMHPISVEQTAWLLLCWSLWKLHFSKITWQLTCIFDKIPWEEASTFKLIWCSVWKPCDSNFWVKICLVRSKMRSPPFTAYNM